MTYNPQLGSTTVEQWATMLLEALNVPVNQTNVDTLAKWAQAESGGGSATACAGRNNPLNSTETHFGTVCQGGAQGDIAGYATVQVGVQSVAFDLLQNRSGYPAIISGLQNSDQAATFAAIDQSAFGTKNLTAGSAPIVGPPDTSGGQVATETAASSGGCPEGNLVTFPSFIPNITRCQGRAMLGAATMAGGVLLIVLGVAVLAGRTRAGKAVIAAAPLVV